MKKPIYTDSHQLNQHLKTIEDAASRLQAIVNDFHELNVGTLTSMSDLVNLVKDPETYIKHVLEQAISEDTSVVSGLLKNVLGVGLSKRKIVDLLEIPDLDGLKQKCSNVKHELDTQYLSLESGSLVVTKDSRQRLVEMYSVCASTDQQHAFVKAHTEAITAVERLLLAGQAIGMPDLLNKPLSAFYTFEAGELKVKTYFYKQSSQFFIIR